MARDHVEFVQAQSLDWTRGLPGDARQDVDVKLLSVDDEDQASSAIVSYSSNWSRSSTEQLASDEAFFVLDGELEINGRTYRPYTFAYLPAGYVRKQASAPKGCVALTFFEGPASVVSGGASIECDAEKLVEFLDTQTMDWVDNSGPSGKLNLKLLSKRLWTSPNGHDYLGISTVLPSTRMKGYVERHPISEEMYMLSGEFIGDRGIMGPGAYFWRPPEIDHGPYLSRTGNQFIIRIIGALETEWSENEHEVDQEPKLEPVLPANLAVDHDRWNNWKPY